MSSPNLETVVTIQARTSLPGIHCLRRSVSALVCPLPRVFEKTPESGGKPFRYEWRNSGDGLFHAIREFQRIFRVFWSIAMI